MGINGFRRFLTPHFSVSLRNSMFYFQSMLLAKCRYMNEKEIWPLTCPQITWSQWLAAPFLC